MAPARQRYHAHLAAGKYRELLGCASTSGEIALSSWVVLVSSRAVETLRFSSDGKGLHPPSRPAPRQGATMQHATPLRALIGSWQLCRSLRTGVCPLILGNERTASRARHIRPDPLPHHRDAAAKTDEQKHVNHRPQKPRDHARKFLIAEFRHGAVESDGRHTSPVTISERQTLFAAASRAGYSPPRLFPAASLPRRDPAPVDRSASVSADISPITKSSRCPGNAQVQFDQHPPRSVGFRAELPYQAVRRRLRSPRALRLSRSIRLRL